MKFPVSVQHFIDYLNKTFFFMIIDNFNIILIKSIKILFLFFSSINYELLIKHMSCGIRYNTITTII